MTALPVVYVPPLPEGPPPRCVRPVLWDDDTLLRPAGTEGDALPSSDSDGAMRVGLPADLVTEIDRTGVCQRQMQDGFDLLSVDENGGVPE